MPGKAKDSSDKIPILKGLEAEEAVLKYLKKMNRPFGAVDVCANLKGAVPKSATQKILVGLSEKGEITQKPYGKTTFFVAKQSDFEDMPTDKLAAIETEHKAIEEENKVLSENVKKLNAELTKLKNTPTDEELDHQLDEAKAAVEKTLQYLTPLRAGTSSLLTADEIAQLDADWVKWRAEWVKRRKVFNKYVRLKHRIEDYRASTVESISPIGTNYSLSWCRNSLWHLISDSLPPQQANELAEDLGIEYDTNEHGEIERSLLCVAAPSRQR